MREEYTQRVSWSRSHPSPPLLPPARQAFLDPSWSSKKSLLSKTHMSSTFETIENKGGKLYKTVITSLWLTSIFILLWPSFSPWSSLCSDAFFSLSSCVTVTLDTQSTIVRLDTSSRSVIFFSADLYNQDEQSEGLLSKYIRFVGQVLVLGGYLKNRLSSFSALFLLIINILLHVFVDFKKKQSWLNRLNK